MEKRSYHQSVDIYWQDSAWVDTEVSCEWVEKTLKKCVPEGEEFLLLCDNLPAQVSDEFKKAVKKSDARPFKVPNEITLMVVDPTTGEKAKFTSKNTIIESYKSKNVSNGKILYLNNID